MSVELSVPAMLNVRYLARLVGRPMADQGRDRPFGVGDPNSRNPEEFRAPKAYESRG